jgi:hypothetical protein
LHFYDRPDHLLGHHRIGELAPDRVDLEHQNLQVDPAESEGTYPATFIGCESLA